MGNATAQPTFFTDAATQPFNPVPTQFKPSAPPQAPGNSPIHAYVAQNKDATPEQVQAQFPAISLEGIKAILPGVKQDLGIKATASPAALPQPPNPVAQAMAPIVPPPPQKGPQLNAFTAPDAPGYEPMGKPQVFPQAVSNTPPAGMPQLPTAAPTPPGPPTSMMPYANTARQATLAGVPGYVPSESAPPGAPVSPMQSGPPPQDGGPDGNSFLDGLKRFAPALAVALLSKNNPSVGASILGGWQQGTDRLAAEKAQQDAVARQTAQQTLENNRQTAQDANTIAQQGREARQTFLDSLDKIDAKSQEQRVKALPDAEAKAMGIDKASFYDKDGKFIPATAADKPLDPVALARVQEVSLKDLHSRTKEDQQKEHDRTPQTAWETKYGIPYDNFTPSETQKDATDAAKAATAQQKADDAAKLIAPKVLELTSSKNFKDAQTKYYNMTAPERTALFKASARLMGVKADDQKSLDEQKIAFEKALGAAAGVNAAAHTVSSQAALAKSNGSGGVTDAVRQHVYSNFIAPVKGFMGSVSPNRVKLDQDGNLMANPAYYTDTSGKVDTAKAGDANDALNEAVSQNGGQRYFGKQATPTGAPQGKQTPRSMAYKNGNTFGGSRPVTIEEGRKLGAQFGFTDIGGKRAEAKDPNGHPQGLALDFMIHGDDKKGQALANYLEANAKENNVKYVIYKQHIWNPSRASEGWRLMEDRGSPTANHMDHVHVTFNDAGGSISPKTPSGPPPSRTQQAKTVNSSAKAAARALLGM